MKKSRIKAPIAKYNDLSEDQAIAKKVIEENTITCLSGKAGSGKTFLAVCYALEKLATERKYGGINKIIITRPTVIRKEDAIGFLPGTEIEKLSPVLQPIYDAINQLEGAEKSEALLKDKTIEVIPLAYMQGRTATNSVMIIDESQHLSREGMEMIFTRIGVGSKAIFVGDDRQQFIENKQDGFSRLISLSDKIEGLGRYELVSNFRNKIIEDLLEIY